MFVQACELGREDRFPDRRIGVIRAELKNKCDRGIGCGFHFAQGVAGPAKVLPVSVDGYGGVAESGGTYKKKRDQPSTMFL